MMDRSEIDVDDDIFPIDAVHVLTFHDVRVQEVSDRKRAFLTGSNAHPGKAALKFQAPRTRPGASLRLAHIGAVEQMFGAVEQVRRTG